MPEGPVLVILKETLSPFIGKKVTSVHGYSGIKKTFIQNQKINDVKTWGKVLLILFPKTTIRIHFLLFGSCLINERKKKINPRLQLQFKNDELNFYMCSVKLIDDDINELFDWSADIMNAEWNEQAALIKLMDMKEALVCDALLDQQIFAGAGNIIKNEVLYNTSIHPLSKIGGIKRYKLQQLIHETHSYAAKFLKWKKLGILPEKWQVYRHDLCPRHEQPLKIKTLGKTKRKTYYCEKCQVMYM